MHSDDNDRLLARIADDPRYLALVRDRSRFAWLLSALMLAAYVGFVLLVAFAKEWLARPLVAGRVTSVGIPLGIAVILFAIALTGVYVRRANRDYDVRLAELLADQSK